MVFVDIVSSGFTFQNLYRELQDWVGPATRNDLRRRIHLLGITPRKHTSPNTWRWQQHADWVGELPARAVRNVSLDVQVYGYFADRQCKVTRSFGRGRWFDDEVNSPDHGDDARQAFAEAVALVDAGRSPQTRRTVVRHLTKEPTIAEPWLRGLVHELR